MRLEWYIPIVHLPKALIEAKLILFGYKATALAVATLFAPALLIPPPALAFAHGAGCELLKHCAQTG